MGCATKYRWPSASAAEGHRLVLVTFGHARDPERLHVYACRQCDGYHVGHHWPRRLISWNSRTSAVQTFGSIGDGYSRRKC